MVQKQTATIKIASLLSWSHFNLISIAIMSDRTYKIDTGVTTYHRSGPLYMNMMGKKRSRQSHDTDAFMLRHNRFISRKRRGLRSPLLVLLLLHILIANSIILPIAAEDSYDDNNDDYFSNSNNNNEATSSSSTPYPTFSPSRNPTISPTRQPTKQPTARPSWSNEAFYEIETDDGYTAEAQRAKIYFSSISDVILCLMCTFFWVLWLVGTIFPTKIQHLYRSEGVVVKGYVVERYVSTNTDDEEMEMQIQMQEMMQDQGMNDVEDMGGLDGMGEGGLDGGTGQGEGMGIETQFEDDIRMKTSSGRKVGGSGDDRLNLPTYHAIVSYIVPGRVASGRRKKLAMMRNHMMGLSAVSENYALHKDDGKPIKTDSNRVTKGNWNRPSTNAVVMSGKPPLTPPRPSKMATVTEGEAETASLSSTVALANNDDDENDTNEEGRANPDYNRKISLMDSYTKSFESVEGALTSWKGDDRGYYKYNLHDDSDYETPMGDDEREEDPEYIGNLFYQFGLFPKPVKEVQTSETVRVKKRFETNELLDSSLNDVEIIVLPGNPGSGILKADFEQEEDYNTFLKTGSGTQMSNFSIGMIGVVLAAVSVIGAVHGALTLPYTERPCKFHLISICTMLPFLVFFFSLFNAEY